MNNVELAIEVDNLSIKYKELNRRKTLQFFNNNEDKYFEAIKGVSFDIYKGETVGLIGGNGSGKSTLLRALSGVYTPDEGKINVFKNRVSLMAIGTGFIKDLSGRDNIYLSGLLLGLSKKEIDSYVNEIIKFSELENFIDKQVRTYSSGMYSRLAFSIAVTIKPDILLIDEVLSVGDSHFKKKSFNCIKEIVKRNEVTSIIVSHNLDSIVNLCNRVIWLDDGKIIEIGEPATIIEIYKGKDKNI